MLELNRPRTFVPVCLILIRRSKRTLELKPFTWVEMLTDLLKVAPLNRLVV